MAPVNASRAASPTTSTVPTADRTLVAQATSSSLAPSAAESADAPRPTSAGVFGIARRTATHASCRRCRTGCVGGLDGDDDTVARTQLVDRRRDLHAGVRGREVTASFLHHLDDGE